MTTLRDHLKQKQWKKVEKALLWGVSVFAFIGSFRIHELLAIKTTEYDPSSTFMEDEIMIKKWR